MKMVKSIAFGVMFFFVIAGAMVVGGFIDSTYELDSVVESCGNGELVVTDPFGEMWVYETDKDYEVGEHVKVTFGMNGTEHYRFDDTIIFIKK